MAFQFNLDRDLCFFDLESTGLNVVKDRIIQIAILKFTKENSEPLELSMMINPGIPISQESMDITGIQPQDLRNKPTFGQVAQKIYDFIGNSDLAGYNSNRFDIPLLMEEFHRVGIDWQVEDRRLIDVQKIFYKMEPRTLRGAYRYYCNQEMENAHDAMVDVRATYEVLKGQMDRYGDKNFIDHNGKEQDNPIVNDIQKLADFCREDGMVDATQRLRYNSKKEIVFNFGKYRGRGVREVFEEDAPYYRWIMSKDFSVQVKRIVSKIYDQQVKDKK